MHFDDRLGTVLRSRIGSEVIARIQYRQLIDLIGTMPAQARSDSLDAAYQRLAELDRIIPPRQRARILGEPGVRLRNPRLIAALAQDNAMVASAAIAQADLSQDEWLDLAPALPLHARALMRTRRDLGAMVESRMAQLGIQNRGLPPAEVAAEMPAEAETETEAADQPEIIPPQAAPLSAAKSGSIRAIVERIEKFRQAREVIDVAHADSPRLPLGDAANSNEPDLPQSFDFHTDADGAIRWASSRIGPAVIGMRLAGAPAFAKALRQRQPVRGGLIRLDGAPLIAGAWHLDATPRFHPQQGGYIGHAGRLRRKPEPGASSGRVPASVAAQGDRLRQMLHELRTPVNAIQGFAEVIQQQLFGPTPHDYRALAANVASDAARMLAGFEELERLARFESGAMELEPGHCEIGAVIRATGARIAGFLAARNSDLSLELPEDALEAALSQGDAERLVWRLLAALAGSTAPGEKLRVCARQDEGGHIRIDCLLPAALGQRQGEELYAVSAPAQAPALSAGAFGTGFALRLARAEIEAAGGNMDKLDDNRGEWLAISLPALTEGDAGHSQKVRNFR